MTTAVTGYRGSVGGCLGQETAKVFNTKSKNTTKVEYANSLELENQIKAVRLNSRWAADGFRDYKERQIACTSELHSLDKQPLTHKHATHTVTWRKMLLSCSYNLRRVLLYVTKTRNTYAIKSKAFKHTRATTTFVKVRRQRTGEIKSGGN